MDGLFRVASKSTDPAIAGEQYVTIASEKTMRVSHVERWAKVTLHNVQFPTLKEAAEKFGSIIFTAMGTKVVSVSVNIRDRETTTALIAKIFSFHVEVTVNQTISQNRDCEITDK